LERFNAFTASVPAGNVDVNLIEMATSTLFVIFLPLMLDNKLGTSSLVQQASTSLRWAGPNEAE
jgi:hypothetical protein